ncbi:SDR family NAD(P)-dependent oxidoreductase [Gemmobacter serpentinus]|uniref:SDR family NAD(P)-dependent oxidoreductase n=1 Tax=Gemmobacter serpentinus TaxID=2652247 RepID=UPI00124CCB0E|nr:SDR family NAD(P)-dependent oxidoreductase [Gemmobacter serpentinus]
MTVFAPGLFDGKVFLVTGASGGVGSAVARLLAQLGARLALSDLDAAALGRVAQELDALPLPGDLRQVETCRALIAQTLATYGCLDGVVNCAGVWVEGDSSDAREPDWDLCLDVNLKAPFFLISAAIPALTVTQGAVVNIASDAGVVGNAGAAIYCASKGGLVTMSKALAVELAPRGVRVNALCPSDILSPMLHGQAARFGGDDPQGYLARLLAHYPQGKAARFITVEEVAQQVAFLLSPAAATVTGAAVMMDFGVTAGY